MTVTVRDLAWAAGFLEGEGYFGGRNAVVSCAQVQRWPLEELYRICGGTISGPTQRQSANKKSSPIYLWSASGRSGAGIMMTLFTLMSPKRKEQIKTTLEEWKKRKVQQKFRQFCPHGHEYTAENTYIYANGAGKIGRHCKTCTDHRQNEKYRIARELRLAEPPPTTCKRGHPLIPENDYWHNGHRECKPCKKIAAKEYFLRNHAPKPREKPTACRRGHPHTPENGHSYTYPNGHTQWICLTCKRIRHG